MRKVRDLIRRMSIANPTSGSPRIVGELAKLGIQVAKATVEKYRVRPRKPPSPTWRAFLKNDVFAFNRIGGPPPPKLHLLPMCPVQTVTRVPGPHPLPLSPAGAGERELRDPDVTAR